MHTGFEGGGCSEARKIHDIIRGKGFMKKAKETQRKILTTGCPLESLGPLETSLWPGLSCNN